MKSTRSRAERRNARREARRREAAAADLGRRASPEGPPAERPGPENELRETPMSVTAPERNGTGKEAQTETLEHRFEEVIAAHPAPAKPAEAAPADAEPAGKRNGVGHHHPGPSVLALFCYENPETPIGQYVAQVARALARRHTTVHLFTRRPFELGVPGAYDHAVGECPERDLME